MRLVIKVYNNGEMYAAETPNDGRIEKVLVGTREVGERLSVYMEIMFDENELGAKRVIDALGSAQEEMQGRKRAFAQKKIARKHKATARKAK